MNCSCCSTLREGLILTTFSRGADQQKRGQPQVNPWDYPPKMGTKKGKGVPTALEAPLPVIFYPLDFTSLDG